MVVRELGLRCEEGKEYRDWSAASVFDAQGTDEMQKSPPLLQSAQSPFQPYVPRNSQQQPARRNDKYKVPDIPKFHQRKSSTKQSINANSLEKFFPETTAAHVKHASRKKTFQSKWFVALLRIFCTATLATSPFAACGCSFRLLLVPTSQAVTI